MRKTECKTQLPRLTVLWHKTIVLQYCPKPAILSIFHYACRYPTLILIWFLWSYSSFQLTQAWPMNISFIHQDLTHKIHGHYARVNVLFSSFCLIRPCTCMDMHCIACAYAHRTCPFTIVLSDIFAAIIFFFTLEQASLNLSFWLQDYWSKRQLVAI